MRRTPARGPHGHAPPPPDRLAPAPPVGPERLEALAQRAMAQIAPSDYVGVVFDEGPVAHFHCRACDTFLVPMGSGGVWRCGDCNYRLAPEAAQTIALAHQRALRVLLTGSGARPQPLAPAGQKGWWAWLWSKLSGRG